MSFIVVLPFKAQLCLFPAHIPYELQGSQGLLIKTLQLRPLSALPCPWSLECHNECHLSKSPLMAQRQASVPFCYFLFYLRALFFFNAVHIKAFSSLLLITSPMISASLSPCLVIHRLWGSYTSSPMICSSKLSPCRHGSTSRRWSRRLWAFMCPRSSQAWSSPSFSTIQPREESFVILLCVTSAPESNPFGLFCWSLNG